VPQKIAYGQLPIVNCQWRTVCGFDERAEQGPGVGVFQHAFRMPLNGDYPVAGRGALQGFDHLIIGAPGDGAQAVSYQLRRLVMAGIHQVRFSGGEWQVMFCALFKA